MLYNKGILSLLFHYLETSFMNKYFLTLALICTTQASFAMQQAGQQQAQQLKAELWFTHDERTGQDYFLLHNIPDTDLHGFTCLADPKKNQLLENRIGNGLMKYKKGVHQFKLYGKKVDGLHNRPFGTYEWVRADELKALVPAVVYSVGKVHTNENKTVSVTNRLLKLLDRERLENFIENNGPQKAKRRRR